MQLGEGEVEIALQKEEMHSPLRSLAPPSEPPTFPVDFIRPRLASKEREGKNEVQLHFAALC